MKNGVTKGVLNGLTLCYPNRYRCLCLMMKLSAKGSRSQNRCEKMMAVAHSRE